MPLMVKDPEVQPHGMIEVVITEKGAGQVINGRVAMAGARVSMKSGDARWLVRLGKAEFTTYVRALKESLSVGNRVCNVGDVAACDPERAEYLEAKGLAKICAAPTPEPDGRLAKGDVTERAVSLAARAAEHQVRKG